ncbi:hypothetical protein [Marinobacter oulmenensis]|uniref:Uncharacterized protein n=1 Tax=Marinobacter oulmenensis TaxID=643747 RepID=A0A840U5W4_9GAMM|nr:hypothetical protein [Marinobacter oulmenensis]MBB5319603.1 hypothetical protein [Marinobacter oulmenensis]
MSTRKWQEKALSGIDALGYQLDDWGITSKVNRHNIAAYLMLRQIWLQGQWDSLQAKMARRRLQLERTRQRLETRQDGLGRVARRIRKCRQTH